MPKDQALTGGLGVPLHALSHAAVTAVFEPVCAREFSPEALDEKLKSIEWVAGMSQKHEAVLEQAMRCGPVVPMRLCTLFSSTEALKRSLADNEGRFLAALERIRGREEWGLKVFCDTGRLQTAAAAESFVLRGIDAQIAAANPGLAFVLRKKREAWLAEMASDRLDALVDEVLEAVECVADDVRLRPILPESATGRDIPMALNAAALVNVSARESYKATIAELSVLHREDGLVFALSGPFPAYSFCDDAASAEGGD